MMMADHLGRIEAPVMIGVGAASDFLAGLKPQAPAGFRKAASSGFTGSRRSQRGLGLDMRRLSRAPWHWRRCSFSGKPETREERIRLVNRESNIHGLYSGSC